MSKLSNDAEKPVYDEVKLLIRGQVALNPSPAASKSPSISTRRTKRAKRRPIDGLKLDNLSTLLPEASPSSSSSFSNQYFNPFFSNIRQNMELCHYSGVQDRIPVRLPKYLVQYQPETRSINYSSIQIEPYTTQKIRTGVYVIPAWMKRVLSPEEGPKYMADCYEVLLSISFRNKVSFKLIEFIIIGN
jgi:hypothetical protein